MSSKKSTEDVEREHLEAFGEPLGAVYHALSNEVVWLHLKWRQLSQALREIRRTS